MNKKIILIIVASLVWWAWFIINLKASHMEYAKNERSPSFQIISKHEQYIDFKNQVKAIHRQRIVEQSRLEEIELAKISAIESKKRKKAEEMKRQGAERLKKEQLKLEEEQSKWMTFNASYYGPDCYGCSGVSAAGIDLRKSIYYNGYRVIAADTNIIPLWTIVEVQTPNETFQAIVLDTGGAIKGYKLDVLVSSEAESYRIGRHDVKLKIVGKYER
ncbi:3D domain-containing protein [Metasolibacillus meyeri]|uniref:3D domain-containing protein n=1 Tax=Metasolibacillus meyeri TaxID=1071052 RepID=UPI000D2F4964|nr:3D domain-containing protein [Metasolibacillus meyeri]